MQNPRIQRIHVDVFELRGERGFGENAHSLIDLAALLAGQFILRGLSCSLVFLAGDGARLRERRKSMHRVLALAIQVGRCHHIVVVVAIIVRRAQAGEFRFRPAGLSFCKIGIGETDRNGPGIRARQFRFIEVGLGKIEIVHRQEDIGRFYNVLRHNPRTINASFRKAECDLTAGILEPTLAKKNLGHGEPHPDAVALRRIESA